MFPTSQSQRQKSVGKHIQSLMAPLLEALHWNEPVLQAFSKMRATVVSVTMSADLRHAKVALLTAESDLKKDENYIKALNTLKTSANRWLSGQKLSLKYQPEIRFVRDTALETFRTVHELLRKADHEGVMADGILS